MIRINLLAAERDKSKKKAVTFGTVGQKLTVLHPKQGLLPGSQQPQSEDVGRDGLSEAEQVILLHRDANRQAKLAQARGLMQ